MPVESDAGGVRCSVVLQNLSEFIDDEVDAGLRVQMRDHLQECVNCAEFAKQYGSVVDALRAARRPSPRRQDPGSLSPASPTLETPGARVEDRPVSDPLRDSLKAALDRYEARRGR